MKFPGQMTREVLRHVTKKPATVLYPYETVTMPLNFRGKIIFHAEKCIGCKLCVKDCPSLAIEINKVGDKRFEAVFRLDRCIYCAQCVDSCNKDALEASREYELAAFSRDSLRLVFNAPDQAPAPAPKPATPPVAADPKPEGSA